MRGNSLIRTPTLPMHFESLSHVEIQLTVDTLQSGIRLRMYGPFTLPDTDTDNGKWVQ